MCRSCKALNTDFRIDLSSDLIKAIAIARDNLANGTISDITTEGFCKPFDKLVSPDKWEHDVLMYRFRCNTCGQAFELAAETYSGPVGWWKSIDIRR
jgi:hypothetical protein